VPTVGVFVDRIEDGYQWPILRGAMDAAHDAGAHLLCFAGGSLGAPEGQGGERNVAFSMATPASVDALVVFAGAIGNRAAPDQLLAHFARGHAVPTCSVAVALPGMSSVCVDNEGGMRSLVEHLIDAHSTTGIAFVRGPAANPEAERRFGAYSAALAGRGAPFSPELVVSGDFEQPSGRAAVQTLLVERKLPLAGRIGAIVAANDAMALGVLAELTDHQIRVPEEVALAGFDDIEESRFALPPLTTVRQPLYEQGRDAVRLVLHELRDGTPQEQLIRHTELVVRRSCGCMGKPDTRVDRAGGSLRGSFEAAFLARRALILAEISRAARGQLRTAGSDWSERLLNAFAEQMRGRDGAFEEALDGMVRRVSAGEGDLGVWNDVVSALRAGALRCLENEPDRRSLAEDLFHDARVMTAQAMDRAQAWRRLRTQERARALGQAAASIASAREVGELARAVDARLPALGIERCYVAELVPDGAGPPTQARLLLAYGRDTRTSIVTPCARTVAQILRQDVPPDRGLHAFAVLPLGDRERAGLAIVELGGSSGYVFEVLRDAFGAALRNIGRGPWK
jgi:DNA-binding LacI/PurR family transcriptional regulator